MPGVTVEDVLALTALRGAVVVAGREGLDRQVSGVNVMEVPDIEAYVRAGELLLTTAYPVRDRPQRLVELLPTLAGLGLAGLALKPLRYLDRLPAGLEEEADRLGFPLLLVSDDTSFNDVMGAVLAVVLAEQGAEPDATETIRERLTGVALAGGGLDEIARTLGGALHRDVAVVDASDTVLGRSSDHVTEDTAALPFRFPVTVAGAVRGQILVGGTSEPALVQRPLIRQACFAAGMHIAQAMAAAELDRRLRVLFLEELVTGQHDDPQVVRQRGRLFGWDLTGARAVVVARCAHELVDAGATASAAALGPDALLWTRGHDVVAVVPGRAVQSHRPVMARWHRRLKAAGAGRTIIAVGSVVDDPLQLAESHAAARAALRIAELTGRDTVFQSTVAVERLLLGLGRGELERFVEGAIGPLIELDRVDDLELCATLEAYLTTGNGAEAARLLYIHYNTLKHRLARVTELTGVDLHDPRERVVLTVALTARHLLPPASERHRDDSS